MKQLFCTSVGQKFLLGLTGLGVAIFTFGHMAGNLLLFVGPEAFNSYGHSITSSPLYPVIELGLIVLFGGHVLLAVILVRKNRAARDVARYQIPSGEKSAKFASRWMLLTGLLLLSFLAVHLWGFRFGPVYPVEYGGVEIRDLYSLTVERFQDPYYSGFYVLSLVVLGIHLSHGISSLFQTLGVASTQRPALVKFAYLIAGIISVGFIIQPIYVHFYLGR